MKKKYDWSNILDCGWFKESEDGSLPWDTIQALSTIAVGHEVRRLRGVMHTILSNIQSLGNDGIHQVIQHEANRIKRAKKNAANRRKRARNAKAAVK